MKALEHTGDIRIERLADGSFRLTTEVWLNRELDEVFEFCSSPHNLDSITPSWMTLQVKGTEKVAMVQGTRIRYRLRLHGLPAFWQSDITAWDPPHRFVDEQRIGPFRAWFHEHTFESVDGGTVARDMALYRVPGGRLVHGAFVERDLRRLFAHRQRRMIEVLGFRD